jgi:hypothetical protein
MMTSCPFRVTLGPFRATLASWGKTLGLLGPQEPATRATWHTTASQNLQKHWMTSWVSWVTSWAFQGLRPGGKGTTPLGTGLPSCLWWNVLLFLRCNPLICLCPLSGSQHPSGGLLAPWRSELIISPCVPVHKGTCPSGMVLKHQQIRPPWAHKSQGS